MGSMVAALLVGLGPLRLTCLSSRAPFLQGTNTAAPAACLHFLAPGRLCLPYTQTGRQAGRQVGTVLHGGVGNARVSLCLLALPASETSTVLLPSSRHHW